MKTGINLYGQFAQKMSVVAALVGVFIAMALPATYFVLSWMEQKTEADYLSRQVTEKLVQTVKINPELWKYSVIKFMRVFDETDSEEIGAIRIYDTEGNLLGEESYPGRILLVRRGSSDIIYNNERFGYVEVDKIADGVLSATCLLFILFTVLGTATAVLLFRYPAGIVRKAEIDINLNIDQLNNLSYVDTVTGLKNRTYMNEAFPLLIEKEKPFALFFLDLDDFKRINDSFGHGCGDLLLEATGVMLRQVIRRDDIIIRFGGDEFMVILLNIEDRKSVERIARQFLDALEQPVRVQDHELFVSASMGIVLYPEDGTTMQQLIRNADSAMYTAKTSGKNRFCFYSNFMESDSMDRLNRENDLRRAVERGEFRLLVQPIFDLPRGIPVGGEILLRWRHPELGLLHPSSFIPMAEESGLIIPIGNQVLDDASKLAKAWSERHGESFRFSINVSPLQFQQENFVRTVTDTLERNGLSPRCIELEITESIAMQHEESVRKKLLALVETGIVISIDDFGTGYASMNYLRKYPIEVIKIAIPFIRGMGEDKGDEAIVSAVISIAHAFGKRTIAEGIESGDQLERLIGMGCDRGQGYLLGKPVPFEEFLSAGPKTAAARGHSPGTAPA